MMNNEYLEFNVDEARQFLKLQRVFDRLKADKDRDIVFTADDYLSLFDEQALAYFWWPTEKERQEHAERWFATPLPRRWTDPSLNTGWDFGSMIDAFHNGEYNLLSCEMIEPSTARLNFYALSYPYGGTGCMRALIECFGFQVTAMEDGGQPRQTF